MSGLTDDEKEIICLYPRRYKFNDEFGNWYCECISSGYLFEPHMALDSSGVCELPSLAQVANDGD